MLLFVSTLKRLFIHLNFRLLFACSLLLITTFVSNADVLNTDDSNVQSSPPKSTISKSEVLSSSDKELIQFSGADYWRDVRGAKEGYTTSKSLEHGVLIDRAGSLWMVLKTKWMAPLGFVAVLGCMILINLAFFILGPQKLNDKRTGRKISRWKWIDRFLHWGLATTFLILSVSGLILVYGKYLFKPILNDSIWGTVIYSSKQLHNYIGPLFFIFLFIITIKWWKKSLFKRIDLEWITKMGGMIGKHRGSHIPAEFSNGGEKLIFWMLISCGLVASLSGFVLDFPMFGVGRRHMELANLIHMLTAVILICGFIFHIYIGLAGMEGALEAMTTGSVDETWAKQHHSIWYEQVKDLPENKAPPK